jgi:hypothetical protein
MSLNPDSIEHNLLVIFFMFIKKNLTLVQAMVQLETIFYPRLERAIRKLSVDVLVLAAGDKRELQFLDILSELQSEFIMLQQLDLNVFLPKLISVSEGSECCSDNSGNLLNSMERVSAKRKKIVNQTLELNQLCNNFMSERHWTETKLNSCKSLFRFYKHLIEYINFQELTVVQAIHKHLVSPISSK